MTRPSVPKKQPKKKTKAKYVPEQVNEVPYRTLTFARSVPPPVPRTRSTSRSRWGRDSREGVRGEVDLLTSVLNDAEADELKDRTEEDVNVDDRIIEPVDKAVTRVIHEMQMRMQRGAEKARVERERAEAGEGGGGRRRGRRRRRGAARGTEKPVKGKKRKGHAAHDDPDSDDDDAETSATLTLGYLTPTRGTAVVVPVAADQTLGPSKRSTPP